jgi:hypothetical protein
MLGSAVEYAPRKKITGGVRAAGEYEPIPM